MSLGKSSLIAIVTIAAMTLALHYLFSSINGYLAILWDIIVLSLSISYHNLQNEFSVFCDAVGAGDDKQADEILSKWNFHEQYMEAKNGNLFFAVSYLISRWHRGVFSIIFWFIFFPSVAGAFFYFLVVHVLEKQVLQDGEAEGVTILKKILRILDWVPERLVVLTMAIAGNFNNVVSCYKSQKHLRSKMENGLITLTTLGALGLRFDVKEGQEKNNDDPDNIMSVGAGLEIESDSLCKIQNFLWRITILWIIIMGICSFVLS